MSSSTMFGPLHSSWFDRWHHSKDYPAEVEQIRKVLSQEGRGAGDGSPGPAAPPPAGSVLDLGCGTGRHLELLAEAGHEVVGVDRAPSMVAAAAARLGRFGARATVLEADLLDLALDRSFDAVTMMFSVLGYQVTNDALLATLGVAHRHLTPGGLLVFDVLDGAVALREGPQGGVTVVADGDRQLLRATTGVVRVDEQVYELHMRLWLLEDGRLTNQTEETHPMRFFLQRELELLLQVSGFAYLGSEPLAGGQPGPSRKWIRLVWARRM